MEKKIGLIGRTAFEEMLFDGQTVKTRNLYEIINCMENTKIHLVDTYQYRKHIIKTVLGTIQCLKECDTIILCLSINGRKYFFPFVYYLNKIFNKQICHCLIGGRLVENIKVYPRLKKIIQSFSVNWVESRELVENLNALGVENVEYMPNFKNIRPLDLNQMELYNKKTFMFCTFSRVQERKGIIEAIEAINMINKERGKTVALLDIYGPIDSDFENKFYSYIDKYSYCTNYRGSIAPEKSVDIVKDYYMLLFPTKYYNEGIPGTIIDALASGVPVIASKWHYCNEILESNSTSLLYDFDDIEGLKKCICYAVDNVDTINAMKKNCVANATNYLPAYATSIISKRIGL